MTWFAVYLAELGPDGALEWPHPSGIHVPERIGPRFPSIGFSRWLRTCRIIEDHWGGVRLDICLHAGRASVEQIRWWATELYGDAVPLEIVQFVDTLDAGRCYAVIALED